MKRLVIIICSVVLLLGVTVPAVAFGIINADKVIVRKNYKEVDFADDVYLLMQEPKNWRDLDLSDAGFNEYDVSMIDGSTATIPVTAELFRQLGDRYGDLYSNYPDHSKTSEAYEKLLSGERNVVLAVAPSEEIKALAQRGNMVFDIEPFALDGFVFIVNVDNPVNSLTQQQVRDIYSGKITNWKEVGGNDETIEAFQRNADSGSQSAMVEFMGDAKLIDPLEANYFTGMSGMISGVAAYDNGKASIGYTYNYYLNAMDNDQVKAISIDGIAPTNDNFANGTYPITTSYYVVLRDKAATGFEAQNIKKFLLSDKGQEMVAMLGYCPVKK
jgi:ABC-type phosphate transport system, periplasmic component